MQHISWAFVLIAHVSQLLTIGRYKMSKVYPYVEDGYVYCKRFKHWRSGEYVYPKNAECFRFKCGK
jgi:hypothetical protein